MNTLLRTCAVLVLAALAGTAPGTTGAAPGTIAGKACITDGSHISVNGRRSYGKCTGGVPVVLGGIFVPPLTETCGDKHGCGTWAAFFLTELIKNRELSCEGNSQDTDGNIIAVCHVENQEINRLMVEMGWGLPLSIDSPYLQLMREAREKGRGLWSDRFIPVERWHGLVPGADADD